MSIGIVIKGTNVIQQGKIVDLVTEVIGGLLILVGLFGWMDLLIFGKWFTVVDIDDDTLVENNEFAGDVVNQNIPSVILIMITMVFGGGKWD